MPPTHISSTARALYRVFIAPNLHSRTSIPLLYVPAFASAIPLPPLLPRTTIRTKTYAKDTRRHALSDHYTLDRAIESDVINFVDEDGTFTPNVPLDDALKWYDRKTHHLVQVTGGSIDEFGRPNPEDLITCRVTSKHDLRGQHQKKLDLLRRQAKNQGAGTAAKNLELNWAIAGGDLRHRLGKLQAFLKDGKKVEVMLGPRQKGRQATEEEVQSVLKAITDAVNECKGAGEVKRDGKEGAVLRIVYQGRKVQEGTKKEVEERVRGTGQEKVAAEVGLEKEA